MKKFFRGLLAVIVIAFVAAALALPALAKKRINQSLDDLEGYKGKVEGVGFALIIGRVTLEQLSVWDTTKHDFELDVPKLTTRISWTALLHHHLVIDAEVYEPVITMISPKPQKVAKKTAKKAQKVEKNVEEKKGKTLGQLLAETMPFSVERFRIVDGTIVLKQAAATEEEKKDMPKKAKEQAPAPPVRFHDIGIVVEDLTNTSESEPATGQAKIEVASGTIKLDMKLWPLVKEPTFDLRTDVSDIQLPALSPLLQQQWGIGAESGVFRMTSEIKAAAGAFKGYVKPFVEDFKATAKNAGPVKKIEKAVADAAAKVLENKKTKEVASKVDFSGRFDQPKLDLWTAVATALRNAFIKALSPRFEKL